VEDLKIEVITKMAEKQYIRKDFALINARYSLTTIEHNLLLKILSLIKLDDEDFMTYQIAVGQIIEDNNHTQLKNACRKMMTRVLEIPLSDNKKNFQLFNWFSTIRYIDGIIEVRIDKDLKPLLLQLKSNFKAYEIKYVLSMKSEYSKRIYELCKQYEKLRTRKIELKELQEMLQVPKSYISKYINFKQKVLEVAEKEINKYSDIKISFNPIKRSRAVFWIEFTIEKNEKNIIEREAFENKIIFNEVKHKNFKILFKKFNFSDEEFTSEFENFCLYNNEDEKKITDDNFKKWCMQKKRKMIENENKNLGIQEQKQYAWDFKKAKYKSDKIKDFLDFDLGVDWLNIYYLKDIKTFEVVFKNEVVKIGWQDVMHPHFDKEEILLFRIYDDVSDMSDEEIYLLENGGKDLMEVHSK